MKNDQERENRLKEAVRDALSTVCWKDENGAVPSHNSLKSSF